MIRVQVQDKPISDFVKNMGRLIAQSLGENMSDFASRKPRVIDKTGLAGKYNFTIEFSCEGCRRQRLKGRSQRKYRLIAFGKLKNGKWVINSEAITAKDVSEQLGLVARAISLLPSGNIMGAPSLTFGSGWQ
jgi:uncharacterized protein (TIGR03435 family)